MIIPNSTVLDELQAYYRLIETPKPYHVWHDTGDSGSFGVRNGYWWGINSVVTWPLPDWSKGVAVEVLRGEPDIFLVPVKLHVPPFTELPGRKRVGKAFEDFDNRGTLYVLRLGAMSEAAANVTSIIQA